MKHMKTVRMEIVLVVLVPTAKIMLPTVSADEENIALNITARKKAMMFT